MGGALVVGAGLAVLATSAAGAGGEGGAGLDTAEIRARLVADLGLRREPDWRHARFGFRALLILNETSWSL